jgi:hypothetical protein
MNQSELKGEEKFEIEELSAWKYRDMHFLDVINGEVSLEECRESLASFRNSKYYTGTQEKFKTIKEE